MDIGTFLTQIGTGLASFLPSFAQALISAFTALFFTTATEGGAVTGLNPLGQISVAFFIIGLSQKVLPGVLSWLRARWRSRGARKRARAR